MGCKTKVWFVADTHLGHVNSLYFHPERRIAAGITLEELQNDKKAAVEKHDKWFIELWNNTVTRNDSVYILGDFCLGNREYTEKILRQLKGKKYMILGNHDKSLNGLEKYFEWVGQIKEVKFTNNQYDFIDPNETFCVELCHFPLLSWNRRPHGTCHIHGHCHGSINDYNERSAELRIDVGLDSSFGGYNLVSLEDVYDKFRNIVTIHGHNSFQKHVDWLMEAQGFRM